MSDRQALSAWLAALLADAAFAVRPMGLDQSSAWSLQQGAIRHESGRFFQVIGARWLSPRGERVEQPLLDQREIGILAFLMQARAGCNQLLVQAKIEPGNVGVIQLAPTCQATASNANRIHGGQEPPFVDFFAGGQHPALYDALQSEQGTRFYQKRNRNLLAVTEEPVGAGPAHRWLAVESLLDLLATDFLVNTDARSVLVCSPWQLLVGRTPFSRYRQGFGRELLESSQSGSLAEVAAVKVRLGELRERFQQPQTVSLTDLGDWALEGDGLSARSQQPFQIRQIGVKVKGREVPSWDQPIIDSGGAGEVVLVCGRSEGVLRFLLRASAEIGLFNRVELTPTVVVEPGVLGAAGIDDSEAVVRACCRQSEEGGRFFQDVNRFRILDVGSVYAAPTDCFWLSLRQIRALLDEEGWLTNEARSALSLLLPWL